MKRFNDEDLHALQMVSEIRPDSISGLHSQNTIIIELLLRISEQEQLK
jgi:hypothetical protein